MNKPIPLTAASVIDMYCDGTVHYGDAMVLMLELRANRQATGTDVDELMQRGRHNNQTQQAKG